MIRKEGYRELEVRVHGGTLHPDLEEQETLHRQCTASSHRAQERGDTHDLGRTNKDATTVWRKLGLDLRVIRIQGRIARVALLGVRRACVRVSSSGRRRTDLAPPPTSDLDLGVVVPVFVLVADLEVLDVAVGAILVCFEERPHATLRQLQPDPRTLLAHQSTEVTSKSTTSGALRLAGNVDDAGDAHVERDADRGRDKFSRVDVVRDESHYRGGLSHRRSTRRLEGGCSVVPCWSR